MTWWKFNAWLQIQGQKKRPRPPTNLVFWRRCFVGFAVGRQVRLGRKVLVVHYVHGCLAVHMKGVKGLKGRSYHWDYWDLLRLFGFGVKTRTRGCMRKVHPRGSFSEFLWHHLPEAKEKDPKEMAVKSCELPVKDSWFLMVFELKCRPCCGLHGCIEIHYLATLCL